MLVGGASAVAGVTNGETVLDPDMLGTAVQAMFDRGRYRRVLLAIETCHGGVMDASSRRQDPSIAGANPVEKPSSGSTSTPRSVRGSATSSPTSSC